MKNECRKGIRRSALLMVAMLILMSILTACGTEGSNSTSYYDLDVIEHTSDFYINDFAGLFTEDQKNKLMAKAVAFDEEYSGVQVVITTVESLESAVLGYEYTTEDAEGNKGENSEVKESSSNPKFTIEQVAYSMYSQYGIGQDDMGILILFSTGDREVRIETGRQMQFYITDSISGRILDDYGMDYFIEDKFAEGLISVQAAVIDEIKEQVPVDWSVDSKENQKDSEETENAAVGAVTGDTNENSEENATASKENKKDNSGKGLIWGFFGSIVAALIAFIAFIRQKFKGKAEKENLEKAKEEEIASMRRELQSEFDRRDSAREEQYFELRRDYQSSLAKKDSQIGELRGKLNDASGEIRTLKTQLEDIMDKYNRAQRLHPEYNFDEEIHEMIESEYRAAAKEKDEELAEVFATPANKDNEDFFNRALFLIDSVQPEVRKYMTSDRNVIQKLYNKAVQIRREFERAEQEKRDKATAKAAYDEIKKVYENNPRGNYQTYDALHAALAIFLGLSVAEKTFFPDNNLIEKLKSVHRQAESDHNDYEAAREAESNVESIIGGMYSADEDDRDKLERAMRYYRNLTSAQQVYFSNELLRKLKKLINEADEDHRRQKKRRDDEEAARRRRRAQQMRSSSHTSSIHRSSYGGHGGRPGGGGASRHF